MTRNRAALAIPAAVLVLSGCGVAAAVTAHTKTVSMVISKLSVSDGQRLRSLPRPAVLPVVKATPPASNPGRPTAPGSSAFLVADMSGAGAGSWLEILTRSGALVAKTAINPTQGWMVAAGPGGAYWTQSGSENVLTSTGAVHRLGAVPADATGVLISPDGTEYAYATADTSASGVTTNKIVVVRVGRSAVTIADRLSDPNHPTADAPSSGWDYYLIKWTSAGIAFARVPTGGCGCGLFDMQMQSAYSATINPVTQVVTPLASDQSCPLSAIGPGGETACFTNDMNTGGTTGLRVSVGSAHRYSFAMSGANIAGAAVFSPDGASLAYVTVPASEDGCGQAWTATLRVINLATGKATMRALGEFTPVVWSANGLIYGTVQGANALTLVSVSPTTLAVTQLSGAGADQLVGIM